MYSHQPICEAIIQEGFNYILTCKPDSHTTLYKCIKGYESLNRISVLKVERIEGKKVKKKFIDTYRFMNRVPLRNTTDTMMVNWCELETTGPGGEVTYRNSYITSFQIKSTNVEKIIHSGRARWKIENENNNTLKTQGLR